MAANMDMFEVKEETKEDILDIESETFPSQPPNVPVAGAAPTSEEEAISPQTQPLISEVDVKEERMDFDETNTMQNEKTYAVNDIKIVSVKTEEGNSDDVIFEEDALAGDDTKITDKGSVLKCSFTRMLVFDTWMSIQEYKSENERRRRVFQTLTPQLLSHVENWNVDNLKNRIANICKRLANYWKQVQRSRSRMLSKYSDWLDEIEVCALSAAVSCDPALKPEDSKQPSTSGVRIDLTDCSRRLKRRRLAKYSEENGPAVNYLSSEPSRSNTTSVEFNTNEVLSLINEAKFSKHQYLLLKEFINSKLPNALPCYGKVLEAKKQLWRRLLSRNE